ncbi:hypothetical protein AAY473_022529, partial [Plecturocebus cupreus]
MKPHLYKRYKKINWLWWHVPAVPAAWAAEHFGRPTWVDGLSLGVPDQSGQHTKALSLQKLQKLAGIQYSDMLRRFVAQKQQTIPYSR